MQQHQRCLQTGMQMQQRGTSMEAAQDQLEDCTYDTKTIWHQNVMSRLVY